MRQYLILIFVVFFAVACKKYEDKSAEDLDLQNTYCNDPLAVNYNWGFPGSPDNSTCIYPRDLFEGTYILEDSVYYKDFTLEKVVTRMMQVDAVALNKLNVTLDSLCPNEKKTMLPVTADRFFKASIDSARAYDSTLFPGYPICGTDTINGFMRKGNVGDNHIRIQFTVYSDTGKISYHIGTAIKQ